MKTRILQTKERLEQTKFFLQKMRENIGDKKIFCYYLNAFLASARSVFHVFKKEFRENDALLKYGKEKEKIPIIRFFIEMRNVSLKEYTPKTKTTIHVSAVADFTKKDYKEVIDSDGKKHYSAQKLLKPIETKIVGYLFVHNSKWFEKEPDVMTSCAKYVSELEKFVKNIETTVT
jgi:hypothetical protein